MSQSKTDKIIEILLATRDGEELAPVDLKLVELCANDWLSERGEVAFEELLANVRHGYKPPWFMGIEYMTRDHQGFLYWKDKCAEHYDHDLWQEDGWHERMKADAEELARRCRWLDEHGKEINITNTAVRWENPPNWPSP
jgi:hypothetical protein